MTKKEVRQYARVIRKNISLSRRQAAHRAFLQILPLYRQEIKVLSYASFNDEFDMWQVNDELMRQGRLFLPKIESEGTIRIFHVTDRERQLKKGFFGVMEPDSEICEEVSPDFISLVFVPGLAFDYQKQRLGYGKGCYDRFLCRLDHSAKCVGVGYREQLFNTPLPTDQNDIALTDVCLF